MNRAKTIETLQELHNVGQMLAASGEYLEASSKYLEAYQSATTLIENSYTLQEISTALLMFLKNDIAIADKFGEIDKDSILMNSKDAKGISYWLAEARKANEPVGDGIKIFIEQIK